MNNEKHIIFTDSKSYANAESNFAVSNVSPFAIGHMLLVPKLHALRYSENYNALSIIKMQTFFVSIFHNIIEGGPNPDIIQQHYLCPTEEF